VDFIYQLDYFYRIILVVFLFAVIVQLAYYLFIYIRPLLRKEKKSKATIEIPPVSVIICARNEQENLSQNLVSILTQDYPSYEVIVVNDCSEDDTEELLARLKGEYPRLRSTIIKKDASFVNGKKFAATLGVKAAKYEWLLFTDADCKPAGPQWISSMSKYFVDKKSIVLGYGGYINEKGFLNRWIKYDTCFIALQYFGFAMSGMPYMGVGRNMAYRKSLFYEHNGFAAHAHILSGDDDLFVNQAATKKNVAVNLSPDSYTYSVPKKTFREWVWQKSRHISTSKYYKPKHSFFLGLEPISRVLFWGVFAILMFQPLLWQYVLAIFLLRVIIFLIIFGIATRKFNVKGIMPFVVFFDLAMPFVYVYVFLLNRISSKQNKWK
jgi:cellulose synthase/poly-beta-1,6-N-acetylglucosamine synthase-like glycosyltransferase